MTFMKHICIKPGCGVSYEDNDPDPYYCSSCNEQRKVIAAEIDAKRMINPPTQPTPHFSEKDFVGRNGRIFFNAKDIL